MMSMENSSSLEELEGEITCVICHEHYTEPKILPCLHYYCKQCINSLAKRKGIDQPFSCPECRTDTTLPQGGVDHLKPAFFVNRMKSVHSKLSLVQGKVEAVCESCSKDKAEAFCRQCAEFICAHCVCSHQRMKMFTSHRVVSLEELKEGGGAKDVVVPDSPLKMCEDHDEKMKIYCFDCSCLICRDCIIKDHSGHKHEFIKKAASTVKKELLELLSPLKEVKVKLSLAVKKIENTKSEVRLQVDSGTEDVKTSFLELRQILANHERELLIDLTTKGTQKLNNLSAQEKKLSTSSAAVQSVIEYTEQCLEHSTDDEVMHICADIRSRIDLEIQEQQDCENLEPVEEANMRVEVSCAEDLKQLCRSKAQFTTSCNVTGKGLESAEVDKISEFYITNNQKPKCQLKYLAKGTITECTVDLVMGNEYRIQYTPTVRGRHEIVLTVNGREIAGSPFPVFVSINPAKLSQYTTCIQTTERPLFIAVNSEGEIITTATTTMTVYAYGNKPSALCNILKEYGFYPWGVTVDSDNHIYVPGNATYTDGSAQIIKLTRELKLVKRTDKMASHFRNLSVVGDKLIVCSKNGSLLVFTKELELIKTMDLRNKGPKVLEDIQGVVSDSQGDLYIISSHLIHVFSNSGQFLRLFSEKLVPSPRGICVLGEYLYATSGNEVIVCTTKGERVTSCRLNSATWGICIDKDGFIYVCTDKRIAVM